LAREHALELRLADARHERGHALRPFGDRRLVPLRFAEVEENARVVDVTLELLEGLDSPLDRGAATRVSLCLLRVVPEAGGKRGVREGLEFGPQSRDVKETPLAP
jgi:hypothetical protein